MFKMTIKPFIIILLLCGLSSCSDDEPPAALFGSPTPILAGESSIDVVCRIQERFRSLPKPLMLSISYQPSWTSYRVGAASVQHRGYRKIQLTPEALNFLTKHSRLELVASLVPLLADTEIGGEAAVLLAGIPAGNKSVQGGRTAKLANALYESYYRSPTNYGQWFEKARQHYSKANTLYGLTNTTESIHRQLPVGFNVSLESKIIEALQAYSRAPYKVFQKRPYMPQPHEETLIRAWVSAQSTPALTAGAHTFVSTPNKQFTALVLFPLLPEPGNSSLRQDELLMMFLLDYQQKYWPTMMSLSSGHQYMRGLKREFQYKIQDHIAGICQNNRLGSE